MLNQRLQDCCRYQRCSTCKGEEPVVLPPVTAMGSMANYITDDKCKKLPTDECKLRSVCTVREKIKKKAERNEAYATRALETIRNFVNI
ncbi:hypothetical protein ACT7DA_11645 [Bacillus pacificus]